jgi:hypothetical protein
MILVLRVARTRLIRLVPRRTTSKRRSSSSILDRVKIFSPSNEDLFFLRLRYGLYDRAVQPSMSDLKADKTGPFSRSV